MSSAALQAAPHQSTTVPALSPTSSPTNRQYASQPSQSRDPYYNQQALNASPPSNSTRRPARRPSGNGATTSTQQQSQQYSAAGSAPTSGPKSSRHAGSSTQISQAVSLNSTPPYSSNAHVEYQRGVPPVAPPRTSSNQRPSGAALAAAPTAERSRRNDSARTGRSGDGHQDRVDSGRGSSSRQVNGNDREMVSDDAAAAASAASRSRRRAQQSPQTTQSQRSNREQRSAEQVQSRSQTKNSTSASTPNGLSREGSEILNRVVVSKPEVDLERERERERMAEAEPASATSDFKASTGLNVVGSEGVDDTGRGGSRSRHENTATTSKREKNTRFGDYFLGNTLGEGEFGKVKMGWKQEGGVQVAIKLIRRDSVGSNPTRMAKIYREIAILREISHPNIVRLHEMVETEKHIGIILEYASGGELFDYILNHRYLKDGAARKLFAQLISGVGYLHKKGIVHRDLKLENLLLDRNRNIIITDFGFANTFNPNDELGEEIEYGLASRDYVKRMELDKILPDGFRRGDLMQTSCGSPCYAAPELVVSDSLYTGRKVDVWSCGVILYAMLAGYLPFDDDPANPEGDNINLLYKYIVSTPLTFPEYVTPHARDLLRRILVPDPRRRADLFEVARHSWLSEYADVVGFITSSTSTTGDIANTTVTNEDQTDIPLLARSASVREPTKTQKIISPTLGDLGRKHGTVDQEAEDAHPKPQKTNKRSTVQVEYVAPRSQTVRGEDAPATAPSNSRTRARTGSQGPVEVPKELSRRAASNEKPLPQDPPTLAQYQSSSGRKTASQAQGMAPPTRPGRDPPRSASDNAYMAPVMGASIARPNTGGSMTSTASGMGSMGLTTRGSYGQPVAPTVAGTNAHGHMSQPKTGKKYVISSPMLQTEHDMDYGRVSISQVPPKFAQVAGFPDGTEPMEPPKGHKRSNTVSGISEKIFGRNVSFFGGKSQDKPKKSYPPVSMSGGIGADSSRQSIDSSRRSISFGFGRKRSGSIAGSGGASSQEKPRRFSLLPASFSLKAIGIGKEYGNSGASLGDQYYDEQDNSAGYQEQPGRGGQSRSGVTGAVQNGAAGSPSYERGHDSPVQQDRRAPSATPPQNQRYGFPPQTQEEQIGGGRVQYPARNNTAQQTVMASDSDASLNYQIRNQPPQSTNRYPQGFNDVEPEEARKTGSRGGRGVLQKNNRRFADAYDQEPNQGYGVSHQNAGSSGAARKVMDFFRRRGRARESDDR